jgi:glycosyltransferase involved in cell wall biosynthesis
MSIRLSILICSLEERRDQLQSLLQDLGRQKTDEVEILTSIDNRQRSIGAKRNELLYRASGDYIAFVDDDDKVANDYVEKILKAIQTNPDCVGMEGSIAFGSSGIVRKFIHSIQYSCWYQKDEVYYRCPNHLSPVKRILALKVMFPNISTGEDRTYSEKLLPFLKTEVYVSKPIYFYYTG